MRETESDNNSIYISYDIKLLKNIHKTFISDIFTSLPFHVLKTMEE